MKNNKVSLFAWSIIITIMFLFFSIPKFIDSKKIEKLLTRINLYQQDYKNDSEDSDGSINIDKNDSTNNNNNSNKNDKPDNDISENNGNQDFSPDNSNLPDDKPNNNNNTNSNNNSSNKINYTAYFYENGSVSISEKEKKCETTTGSCKITLPTILSNKNVMGWNEDKNATHATYKPGETITINKNKSFYAITTKTLSAILNGNGAFAGSQNVSCTIYNTSTMCSVTLPNLEKDFYTSWGYNRNPASDKIEYQENQTLTLNQNIELYAIRKINTDEFDKFSNVAQSVFQKINSLRQSKGLNTLSWSKSMELSAMLRVNELKQNYDFNVNGDYHYRISNSKPFNTVNELVRNENYFSVYKILDADEINKSFTESEGHYNNMVVPNNKQCGIAIGFDGEWYYIVELFG